MNLTATLDLARTGRLYPAVILHGGKEGERRQAALELARCLLCEVSTDSSERPCGSCRHCRRIAWPSNSEAGFHPDFQVLERDLKTVTSIDATKAFLRGAHVTPFEADGQVFVVANAETLSGEAANSLLKLLEEPPGTTQRHFLLLAPSQFDLLPTLRSRSLAIFLGTGARPSGEGVTQPAEAFRRALESYLESRHSAELLAAAAALKGAATWNDPRARGPWELAAAVASAVNDALHPLGIEIDELPLRIKDIEAAIHASQQTEPTE